MLTSVTNIKQLKYYSIKASVAFNCPYSVMNCTSEISIKVLHPVT